MDRERVVLVRRSQRERERDTEREGDTKKFIVGSFLSLDNFFLVQDSALHTLRHDFNIVQEAGTCCGEYSMPVACIFAGLHFHAEIPTHHSFVFVHPLLRLSVYPPAPSSLHFSLSLIPDVWSSAVLKVFRMKMIMALPTSQGIQASRHQSDRGKAARKELKSPRTCGET